ncbi:hypothetical protein [Metallibacterium scheffleri]|uniref:hypothetical protein n=1 Tax=Metallibacterium scheffleri TaxID=993689 RepID=UPI0023EF744C|nr:hypothetical protein [Metallibacterium scheffleri]
MAEIVHFVPRAALDARDNLKEFIRVCRDELTVFGADLDWNANTWPQAGVSFGNLDQTTRKLLPSKVMKTPFLDFAKAYFRYQQGHKPTVTKIEMKAFKCLERALDERERGMDIQHVDASLLDRAAVLARGHYSARGAYQAGRELGRIARFISAKQLIVANLDWKSPIARPGDTVRTGRKAQEERDRKLPSDDALNALADIFASNPKDARDVFTTSIAAMLLCAPSRFSELLALPEDCEVWETKRDGKRAYGWRFQPGKGGAPMIKWIPDAMVEVAQEAVRRVRDMTTEARRIASWLEQNPGRFYRHSNCPQVEEDVPLSVLDAAAAVGFNKDYAPYCRIPYCRIELRRLGLSGRNGGNTLASINTWAHARLPEGFPWFDEGRGVRFSGALFCVQLNALRTDTSARPYMIWRPTIGIFNKDLCSRQKGATYDAPGVFDRLGFNTGRTKPLKVTSHQFRHLINTMGQRGGLGQSEIARWSGRVDVKQNRVYDHMSEFELVDMLRQHDPGLSLDRSLSEIAEQIATQLPMTRQEFNALTIPTAHVTEYGFCIHDYVMSPCQRFRDCLNCTEQVCIKGDRRLDRIRTRYAQVSQLMERARREIAEGSAGADRWYDIHALTEKRLGSLLTILEDPSIKDGAIIQLNNDQEFSPLRRALDAKTIAGTLKEEHRSMLDGARQMLEHSDG